MVYIYVLELTNNKYYIGKTNNPDFRLAQHFNDESNFKLKYKSSYWTKKYKPIKLLESFEGDDFDENKYTLIYMDKYGIDNVRGGSFCQVKLSKEVKQTIILMINGTSDKCYKCGKTGHFINDCPSKKK